LLTS
jgi:hypothetical protein